MYMYGDFSLNGGDSMYSSLPTLDLHGENRETARILINEFITDNIKMGNHKVLIIHGIGKGIIRKETRDVLEHDNRIDKFYIDFFNVGSTVVEIKENIDK